MSNGDAKPEDGPLHIMCRRCVTEGLGKALTVLMLDDTLMVLCDNHSDKGPVLIVKVDMSTLATFSQTGHPVKLPKPS